MATIRPQRAGRIIAYLRRPENVGITNREAGRRLGITYSAIMLTRHMFNWGAEMNLSIRKIRRDGGLQPRAKIDEATVADYAEQMEAGTVFPPVTVYYDGESYWLADGFHRVAAAVEAGLKSFEADVKQGDKRDALLFTVGANSKHGLRRTNADKCRSVMTLLNDEEWYGLADNEISRRCGVSQPYVAKLRAKSIFKPLEDSPRTVSRNGSTYKQDTKGIGAKSQGRAPSTDAANGHSAVATPTKAKPVTRTIEDKSPDFADDDFRQDDPDERENVRADPEADAEEPATAPVPTGKSIINGVLQDDDERTAADRRRGTMPAGAVPVITINDPATFPVAPPPEREPGDQDPETVEEWLGTLPLYRRLANEPLKKFVAAAKLFYRLRPHREAFRHGAADCLKGLGHDNELAYFLKTYLKIGDPKHWPVCPPTKEGGCDGLGQLPGIDEKCPKCRGRGFLCRGDR